MFNGLSGKTSIMRVLTAIVVIGVMATWICSNIICWTHACQFIAMDVQSVAVILGVLGAKAAQRAVENGKKPPTTNDIPKDLTQ
jgi:hypothetical protein